MKVELSIKDDSELRNTIKDMIRGQISSIVRDEVIGIVHEEAKRKIETINTSRIFDLVRDSVTPNEIKEILEAQVKSVGTEWLKRSLYEMSVSLTKELFANKTRELIQSSVAERLRHMNFNVDIKEE